ncbi:SCL-interrupting locus protein [Candoia aspera]|uniref:SCL-interrupting locus protein n=1 Tax=Candoia aspera TaxID=51853 RepID=UPI002FD7BF6F
MEIISPESQNQRGVSGKMLPFSFPPSKFALWNPAPIGESTVSHLNYRNPKLIIAEKTLRLAHRHAMQCRKKPFTCFLVGTLAIDEDGERVLLTVDRFDPGREEPSGLGKIPTAPLPGDFFIPCRVDAWGCSSNDTVVHTFEDFSLAFKILHQNLNSQDSLELSKLLTLRVHISSMENMDNLNFDFHWAAVTVANALKYTPVKPVPIIPTALARNLSSSMSIAHVQGTYKCGYISMDRTRKLLLILESDPKVYTLPLIGIWLSGIFHIHNPQVWAFCLRYLYSSSIQERVLSESGSFLVVLFALNHKDPKFYECFPYDGHTELDFQLLTCKETLHLFKDVEPSDKYPIQFELNSENKNAETEFFSKISKNVSINSLSQDCSPNKLSVSDHDSGVEDDASPRPFPRPHPINQQMTEIHPSVPELSIVLEGVSTESVSTSKYAVFKNQPSFGHQPAKMAYSVPHTPQLSQSSDTGRQIFASGAGEPSPKQISSHLKHRTTSLKLCKGMQSPVQLQSSTVGSQARKGSVSTSASPSVSCKDLSQNTSLHQRGIPSERHLASSDDVQQKGELPINGFSVQKSNQPPVVSQYPWHTCALSPSYLRRPLGVRIPVQGPSCCSPCICNCQQYGHIQYNPANVWQGLCNVGSNETPENHSSPTQESTKLTFHQNQECVNGGCNPVCATSSPMSLGHCGIIGNCSPINDNTSAAVRISSPVDPGNAQAHTTHLACMHLPAANAVSDNEMMELSSDVYRILAEQHKQIKLLQAQIQQLLEAQALQSCASRSIGNNSLQSEKQVEFVAMETQSSPGLHMKKSVSIAVSTGASLFWNPPLEKKKESVKEDEVEISNEDITISMNTEKDSSQTSIASSLKAVDIPSFVDSVHIVEGGANQSSTGLCNGPLATGMDRASLQNENGNQCLQARPSEGTDNNLDPTDEQNFECIITSPPNVLPDDQKIYQDILGQVNRFLKESSDESGPSLKEDLIRDEHTTSLKINKAQKRGSTSDMIPRDKDSVLNATLKQLRNLGVTFDSPEKMNNVHKVENAGVLAYINPEAIVPGLNYISFANVGMSGLTPTGADLSMEANAIALKYLNENQLSQLSLNHSSDNSSVTSSLQTLLHTNTEKSLMGLGLISPGNMSFATKRYMRKYGLLHSSDDEEEQPTENYRRNEPVLHLDFNPVLGGFASWKGSSERPGEKQIAFDPIHCETELSCRPLHSEGPILRNVTNAVFPPRIPHQSHGSPQPFLKDLKPKMKLLPGDVEFTQHPDKENLNVHIVTETPQAPAVDNLNQADNVNSVGTFLDIKQLRQLPKLF